MKEGKPRAKKVRLYINTHSFLGRNKGVTQKANPHIAEKAYPLASYAKKNRYKNNKKFINIVT